MASLYHFLQAVAFESVRRIFSYSKNIAPFLYRALPRGISSRIMGKGGDVQGGCECVLPPGLTAIAPVEKLSKRVTRVSGLNPGKFTLHGTNTYLVGVGPSRFLVDTGEGRPGYVQHLQAAMKEAGCERIEAILCTHRHYDHIGGVKSVRAALGEPAVYKFMQDGVEYKDYTYNSHVPADIPWRAIVNGQKFTLSPTGGLPTTSLRTVYTPGHSEDSVCFILEEEGSIFVGDNVLGTGTTWFENLFDYMASLHTILNEVRMQTKCSAGELRRNGRLYTGHGPHVEDGEAKITSYIEHRMKREAEVMGVLEAAAASTSDSPWLTSLQITKLVYPGLDFKLIFAAHSNVCNHLLKLQREERVIKSRFLSMWSIDRHKPPR